MQIKTEETRKEIKNHGDFSFPVNVCIEHIEAYEQGMFLWHWHPEIELTYVLSGRMEYRVNDKIYFLKSGEGIFGNSNTLHSGIQLGSENCSYLSITFHPRFLYGYEGSILQRKYVDFIVENTECSSFQLEKSTPWKKEIMDMMLEIYETSEKKEFDYELKIHILLTRIWHKIYSYFYSLPQVNKGTNKNMQRLQEIIAYLQDHYSENITLDEISGHINICKNECCRFFKKYMNMTIMEYLTVLRIQNSLPLLKQGESVTRAANLVGFASPAYFCQMFKRHMGMKPKEYQKTSF